MSKKLLFRLVALVAAMMCALSASAAADVCDFSQDGIFYKIQSDGTTVYVWYEDASSWDPCYTVDDYNIPETVTYNGTTYTVTGIGPTAFYDCTAVTHVSLPKTLTRIDSQAFTGCTSLNSVYCHAMTPPALHSSAFDATAYSNVLIYVPASVTSAYAAATNWSSFQNLNSLRYHFESGGLYYNISGSNTVSVVRKDDYYNSEAYKGAIDIPATVTNEGTTYNVTTISSQAFYRCWQLTEVNIGNNVTTIGSYAFQQCSSLTQVSIPASVTAIGVYAFTHCTSLTTIICWATTPPSVSTAFNGLFNQATLYVPASAVSAYQAATIWKDFSNIQPIPEAYACYTSSNTTLTFYYDNQRSSRPGTTYDLNDWPGWYSDGTCANVTKAVIASSFANARPTSTSLWFYNMANLQSITGMEYFNTSEVTDMSWMFADCVKLASLDVSHFNTAKVTNMSYMFRGCKLLTSLDVSNFNTARVTSMESMFGDCRDLTSLDVSNFNTANVTNMSIMFSGCNSLTSLDVSNFNTAKVTDMSHMFRCKALTSLDLSSFNTSSVTKMGYMFYTGKALTSLDLSSFNTSKVTEMWMMFCDCSLLKTIYVGDGWSTAAVTGSGYMFSSCTNIVGGKGTTYDENHVDAAYAHIDGGPSNPGYFTEFISLDDALNVAGGNIHFVSTGDYPWTAVREGDRVYAISGNTGVHGSVSKMTATVTINEASTLSFDFKAWGEGTGGDNYDYCAFFVDNDELLYYGARDNDWERFEVELSAGSHTLMWMYSKDSFVNPTGDYFAIDNVALTSALDRALNVEGGDLHFTTGGDYPWIVMIDDDGESYARSSNAGVANSVSTLTTTVTVTVPGTSVITVFKARGEGTTPIYDACTFKVDGNEVFSFGSALGDYWNTNNSTLEVGTHTLTWTYSKDNSVNPDGDFFAVSQVSLYIPASLRGDVNGDNSVSIADVSALIDYLLSGNTEGVNMAAADCDQNDNVGISDVSALIDYLLSGSW